MVRILPLLVLLLVGRSAFAQEELAGAAAYAGVAAAGASAVASALIFTVFDFKVMDRGRRPSLTHAVLEVVFSQLHLMGGAALLADGADQGSGMLAGVGGVMVAASLPMTVHGMWALTVDNPDTTPAEHRRRRTIGGGVELGLSLLELAVAGASSIGFAYDPVDHVREAGLVSCGVLGAGALALGIHGVYLLGTRNRRTAPPPVTLAPSLGREGAGVALAGRF